MDSVSCTFVVVVEGLVVVVAGFFVVVGFLVVVGLLVVVTVVDSSEVLSVDSRDQVSIEFEGGV